MTNSPADSATEPERWLTGVCKIVAAAGGMVLLAITVLTVVSVIGRSLFNAPLPGDFELVELGCAIAIFAFLPYCQIRKGNVIVDFFTAGASPATNHFLSAIGDLIYLLIAALITWRLVFGALDFHSRRKKLSELATHFGKGTIYCCQIHTENTTCSSFSL